LIDKKNISEHKSENNARGSSWQELSILNPFISKRMKFYFISHTMNL
jgi:hypothetical protein